MTSRPQPFIEAALNQRRDLHQLRRLREVTPAGGPWVEIEGQRLINFSSNDYLGLSNHPDLVAGAQRYLARYGVGATASRLVCGSLPCFGELERRLASLKGSQAALIMNSGFQANISLLPAVANRHTLVLADRLCHNSLNQGILLSRARLLRFRHNDLNHLRQLLKQHQGGDFNRILIVSESVFSMDGDRCDVDGLLSLSREYQALLLIDEAHATGVFGPKGMGLTCGKGVDLVMGTFGKGLGSFGAYLACSEQMRDYLVNYCAGFIYSTALPPPVLGAIDAALDLVPEMDKERNTLLALATSLRQGLQALGLSTGGSTSQIVPIILGGDQAAIALSEWLVQHGILATAIRPPTVEAGQARLRLALTCHHSQGHIDQLLHAIHSRPTT